MICVVTAQIPHPDVSSLLVFNFFFPKALFINFLICEHSALNNHFLGANMPIINVLQIWNLITF